MRKWNKDCLAVELADDSPPKIGDRYVASGGRLKFFFDFFSFGFLHQLGKDGMDFFLVESLERGLIQAQDDAGDATRRALTFHWLLVDVKLWFCRQKFTKVFTLEPPETSEQVDGQMGMVFLKKRFQHLR